MKKRLVVIGVVAVLAFAGCDQLNDLFGRDDDRHRGQQRPTNTAVSLERAIEIGYEEIQRRGYTGRFLRNSGMDWEYGQWVWELEFSVDGGRRPRVEIYVNVDTGRVVKFEWDS